MSDIKKQILTLLKQRHHSHKVALEQEKDPRSKHAVDLIARIRENSQLIELIDSLPGEIPPYCTGFKGDPDPPGISDLEEAAARYERENRQSVLTSVDIVNAFIEGAKWQKEQDEDRLNEELMKAHLNGVITGDRIARESSPMPEDTVIFQRGVAEGRRMEREETPRWKKGPADSAICARDYWPVSNAPVLGKPETRDYLIVKRGKSMLLAFHAEEGDYYLSTEELDKIPKE